MQKGFKFLIFSLLIAFSICDTAIVTYHLYTKYELLTTVSCSDGANGLMSWGYKDLSYVFPYVTAWQPASWNSPQCGSCAKITWNGKYTYVTVIDQCGIINSAYSHFDMSKQAFYGLFGDIGIAKGTMTANFTIVASKYCPGNRKGVQSASPVGYESVNQNLQVEAESQNPLWVRKQSATQKMDAATIQYASSTDNVQSSQNTENPLWIEGSSGSSESSVSAPNESQMKTQWGGYSYDKQNQNTDVKVDDNF